MSWHINNNDLPQCASLGDLHAHWETDVVRWGSCNFCNDPIPAMKILVVEGQKLQVRFCPTCFDFLKRMPK